MRPILIFVAFMVGQQALAQDFSIKRVEMNGDQINLYYDLLDSATDRTYTIKVFSSRDNFISPLEKVSGDVGLEVKPGGNHKITWDPGQELGPDFAGKVSLEIRGRVYIPFIRLSSKYEMLKRDKPYEFTWTGGTEQNILNFELLRNGVMVKTFPNIANVGHHPFVIPTDVKPGDDYSFRITDTKNQDQIVNTTSFTVKRKVPMLLKVVPFVAVAAFLALQPKSSTTDTSIPAAPGHP